jgi:hypothetical protein
LDEREGEIVDMADKGSHRLTGMVGRGIIRLEECCPMVKKVGVEGEEGAVEVGSMS